MPCVILSCLTASVRLHLASMSDFKGRLPMSCLHSPSYISCSCVLLICITPVYNCFMFLKKTRVTAVRVDIKAEARWFYFLHLLWGWDYTCGFCVWFPLKSEALKPSREFRLLHVEIRSMCLLVGLPFSVLTRLFLTINKEGCAIKLL